MIGCFDNSIWDQHISNELAKYDEEEDEEENPNDEYNPDTEMDKLIWRNG